MVDIESKFSSLQFTKDEVSAILAKFNRTIDNVVIDINCIKDWISTQPHLKEVPEDRIILNLLIMNKFLIQKVKYRVDNYYSIRCMIPEVFADRLPTNEDIRDMRKIVRTFTLPKLVNLNRVIFFVLDEMHPFDVYTHISKLLMDVETMVRYSISYNIEFVIDCTQSNLTYWSAWTPVAIKKFLTIIEKLSSFRCKAMRLIGLPTVAHVVVNTVIAYFPEKIRKRVTMHRQSREMMNFYPTHQLPSEYGGEGTSSYREMAAQLDEIVEQSLEYFRGIQNYRVDPKLRPEKLDNDEFLGYYGNFRKVDVD